MNVAGIKVGDITDVDLEDGHAVVSMLIEDRYAGLIKERRDRARQASHGPSGHDPRGRPGHA